MKRPELGTRVLGLGLESDSSLDLVGLGLESCSCPVKLGLGLDLRHAGLGLGLNETWTRCSSGKEESLITSWSKNIMVIAGDFNTRDGGATERDVLEKYDKVREI